MKSFAATVALAGFASTVAAHGFIKSPTPRLPGPGLKAACGDQVFNTQNSDKYGNVQGSIQNLQGSHPDCRIWQCKGVPFADAGEVFSYTPGQKVPIEIEIRAPHDGGANMSIVSVKSDKVIGEPLISWDKYALTSSPMSQHPDWTNFEITMPDVSDDCANAGDCVIQWFWDAPTINQTYESCIDFKMGSGSSSSPAPAPASSAPASPSSSATPTPTAPTATPAPSSSKVAEVSTPSASAGSGSGAAPKTFTVTSFIAWLDENAGTEAASKMRRMIAAGGEHARAFRL